MKEYIERNIVSFLNSDRVIDLNTPNYIRNNLECIRASIDRDIDSVRFLNYSSVYYTVQNYTISKALEKGYVLHEDSPDYLLENYKIVKSSISLDVNSADYVEWYKLESSISAEEMDELIDILLEKGYVLHGDSRGYLYLCGIYEIAKNSISLDVNSADFVDWAWLTVVNSSEKVDELVDIVVEKGYVLHRKHPVFLRKNYKVVKNSINLDVRSADYVYWEELESLISTEEINELIDILIEKGYVLHEGSPDFLRSNPKLVLSSLKTNIDTAAYVSGKAYNNKEVFEYALSKDIVFPWECIRELSLDVIRDKKILNTCMEQSNVYLSENILYRNRLNSLFNKILSSSPTIDIYENVFLAVAKEDWETYRKMNANILENLFGKISAELQNSNDFEKSIGTLSFLGMMKQTLGDKYADFYQAMKEYFDIYHSDAEDKLNKMQSIQNRISYYAALYCGKVKDNYIKNQVNSYYGCLKEFFVLRLDNSTVDKKLIQPKRKAKFKELYQEGNEEIIGFIGGIIKKYSDLLEENIVSQLIDGFILEDKAKIEEIIPKPDNYDAYERYERVDKLIKRLNLGYISLEGPEVRSYLDIIGFDKEKGLYVYTGVSFSEENQNEIKSYKKTAQVFEKIKRDITLKIKEMNLDLDITEKEKEKLAKELPFTDEYFEFNKEYFSKIAFSSLYYGTSPFDWSASSLVNDETYALIYSVLIEQGIMWLLTLLQYNSNQSIKCNGVNSYDIGNLVINASSLINLAKELNIDLNSFEHIKFLTNISLGADLRSISILGLDIVEKLCKELGFTNGDRKVIVSRAEMLVSKMVRRSMSTVPYVNGETMNYKYSLYDSQDVDVLLAGINTDACFKVCGNDNDFLHYCCLDKNGFVIKITDKDGNFIGRAGGFRNGNCVFLNQLRTIYDVNGNHYKGEYEKETNEIIETLRKACEDIVRTSQENELESKKINHVFITKSYSLKKLDSNVSTSLGIEIGDYPMDMDSQDWREFIDDNPGVLNRAKYRDPFTTDYASNYSRICIATIKNPYDLEPDDLSFGDVPALYERTRNKIIATTNIDSSIMRKIKRIRGVYSYLNYENYLEVRIPEGSTVFVGDNWYCIYLDGGIVESCVLEFDEKAKREFGLVQDSLKKSTNDFVKQQLEGAHILVNLQSDDVNAYRLNKALKSSKN